MFRYLVFAVALGACSSGSGPSDAGTSAACNALTVSGDFVPETAATGTAPTAAGGPIADGTYLVTRVDVYPPSIPTSGTSKGTYQITGDQVEIVSAYSPTSPSVITNSNYSASTDGTTWTLTRTCPLPAVVDPESYTATPTTILFIVSPATPGAGTYVQTLTKQ